MPNKIIGKPLAQIKAFSNLFTQPIMDWPETLTQTMNRLKGEGYIADLNQQLPVPDVDPESFHIDAVYRFEGPTDPGDEMILYAVFSSEHNLKGVLTNAFGMYADAATARTERLLCVPVV